VETWEELMLIVFGASVSTVGVFLGSNEPSLWAAGFMGLLLLILASRRLKSAQPYEIHVATFFLGLLVIIFVAKSISLSFIDMSSLWLGSGIAMAGCGPIIVVMLVHVISFSLFLFDLVVYLLKLPFTKIKHNSV